MGIHCYKLETLFVKRISNILTFLLIMRLIILKSYELIDLVEKRFYGFIRSRVWFIVKNVFVKLWPWHLTSSYNQTCQQDCCFCKHIIWKKQFLSFWCEIKYFQEEWYLASFWHICCQEIYLSRKRNRNTSNDKNGFSFLTFLYLINLQVCLTFSYNKDFNSKYSILKPI